MVYVNGIKTDMSMLEVLRTINEQAAQDNKRSKKKK